MANIVQINTVGDYERLFGYAGAHPLISVMEYATVSPVTLTLNTYHVYAIFFLDAPKREISHGLGRYHTDEGTIVCIAPGQTSGRDAAGEKIEVSGWGLLFHPDLLHGTPMEKKIFRYPFFDYAFRQALCATEEELQTIFDLLRQLQSELTYPPSETQNAILAGYIEVILGICQRMYSRLQHKSEPADRDILSRLEQVLIAYYEHGLHLTLGLPTVHYCADNLSLTANYLSAVVRRASGMTPKDYIARFLVQQAKTLLTQGVGIAQVAYRLGFDYPPNFSRFFRRYTGLTPSEYRA